MPDSLLRNKRIAKNTLMLYIRMFLVMLVSLYTSRVILNVLGAEDYGIYNVVGGVVTLLSFLNSSLSTATQRYLNYEMGKNNTKALNKVFSMSFIIFCILTLIAVLIAETVGLWFVQNKLVIPDDRRSAALWVYQFSIMTFAVNMLMIPYTSAIIANEHMSIYAYLSVLEILLKLGLVLCLTIISFDKLKLYSIMMFAVTCFVTSVYKIYCTKKFPECHIKWVWDKSLLKQIFSFSGWMLLGTFGNLLCTQGINILINIYFGPLFNAARAVATQVYSSISSFSQNFMTAVRPQIIKSYAQNDLNYMYRLVFSSSKLSFYLLFVLCVPLIIAAHIILELWLKNVPDFAVLFTRLTLIDLLIQSIYSPIAYVSQAANKTREYQISITVCSVSIFVVTLVLYIIGWPVYITFIVSIVIDFLGLFVRLVVVKKTNKFPIFNYLNDVLKPIVVVSAVTITIIWLVSIIVNQLTNGKILIIITSLMIPICTIWLMGIKETEKKIIKGLLCKIF